MFPKFAKSKSNVHLVRQSNKMPRSSYFRWHNNYLPFVKWAVVSLQQLLPVWVISPASLSPWPVHCLSLPLPWSSGHRPTHSAASQPPCQHTCMHMHEDYERVNRYGMRIYSYTIMYNVLVNPARTHEVTHAHMLAVFNDKWTIIIVHGYSYIYVDVRFPCPSLSELKFRFTWHSRQRI